ncbi:hypothetical protein LM599_04075 [Candidatus Acetothermia bacterium]|jgi:hypothetical protein|nr:hypothetical protein [Candidatus Acetothermia bacterium]MCI2427778.1 hypothetical protein [Candidatus Acetothermia bacterium]MCI2428693.1 hypothetical protein [Candidatus Acetothermia bacterium]
MSSIVKTIQQIVDTDSVAAAYILLLPLDDDRLKIGRSVAAALISPAPSEVDLVLRGGHPDLLELTVLRGKEKVGRDQIGEMIRTAQFAPIQGERRVCLIERAEELSLQAANRLLKILEEPPSYLVFVLCATGISDLLPTIVSRSQVLRPLAENDQSILPAVDEPRLIAAGYTISDIRYLTTIAQGKRELLSAWLVQYQDIRQLKVEARKRAIKSTPHDLLTAVIAVDASKTCVIAAIEQREAVIALIERIAGGEKILILYAAQILAKQGRETAEGFLRNLLCWCRELLRYKLYLPVSDAEEEAELQNFADRIQLATLIDMMHAVTKLWQAIGKNVSVDGILLSSLIKLAGLFSS